jgi:hypothetical protein
MIPGMVNVLEQCLKEGDEESAGEIFEVFDTLLMLVSYMQYLVHRIEY